MGMNLSTDIFYGVPIGGIHNLDYWPGIDVGDGECLSDVLENKLMEYGCHYGHYGYDWEEMHIYSVLREFDSEIEPYVPLLVTVDDIRNLLSALRALGAPPEVFDSIGTYICASYG